MNWKFDFSPLTRDLAIREQSVTVIELEIGHGFANWSGRFRSCCSLSLPSSNILLQNPALHDRGGCFQIANAAAVEIMR